MALNDQQHVEAVAIMRRLVEGTVEGGDPEAWLAAKVWLRENHPDPGTYIAALRGSAVSSSEKGG